MSNEVLSQGVTAQTMEARYERARDLLRGAYSDQVVFNDVYILPGSMTPRASGISVLTRKTLV